MLNHHPTPTAPCPPRPLFAMTWTKLNFPPHRHKYKQAGTHTRRHPHFQPFSILLHLDGCVLKSTHPPPSQPPIHLSSRPAAIWPDFIPPPKCHLVQEAPSPCPPPPPPPPRPHTNGKRNTQTNIHSEEICSWMR